MAGSPGKRNLAEVPDVDSKPELVPTLESVKPPELVPAELPPVESDHPSQLSLDGAPAAPVQTGEPARRRRRTKAEMAAARGGPALSRDQIAADRALLASAFDGTFVALSMALGDHWRLQPEVTIDGQKRPAESVLMAEVWEPVFERYGGKITGDALMWISASTVTVAIVAPRVRQSVQRETGVIGWIKRKLAERRARRAT